MVSFVAQLHVSDSPYSKSVWFTLVLINKNVIKTVKYEIRKSENITKFYRDPDFYCESAK